MKLFAKHGSPFWWVTLSLPDGRRLRVSTKVRCDAKTSALKKQNEESALVKMHQLYADAIRQDIVGAPPKKVPITCTAFFAWYGTHIASQKQGATRQGYRLDLFARHFGDRQLGSVTPQDVQEFIAARLRAASRATVWSDLALLRPVFKAAIPKHLSASPLDGLKFTRGASPEKRVLTHAEEARLMKHLSPTLALLTLTGLDTILRLGDLLRLKWADDRGTHLVIHRTKNQRPFRVPISSRLRTALNAHRQQATVFQPIFSPRGKPQQPFSAKYITVVFTKTCRQAGIHGFSFHDLRHTGATRFLDAGGSLRELQAWGNWKTINQLVTYTHPDEDAIARTIEKIGTPSVTGK